MADSNEAVRCEFISAILHAALYIVKKTTKKELILVPQLEVIGDDNTGRVDYAIKALEELICITESKQYAINIGFVQNVLQCECALQTNKKKRKAEVTFFDFLYGIVTSATEWYIILYNSDGIFCTSKNPLKITFSEEALVENSEEEKELFKNLKRILEVIVGILKDRVEIEKSPNKKQRLL